MEKTTLKNGKIVCWYDEIISRDGIRVVVETELLADEKKEFQQLLNDERDVVSFYYLIS